ncbi:zinc knuckle domain protein [Fonsecaea pedrosoi]|nr:zinc knuckle domain protein [Fonsecaea pedrosoi]
MDRGCYNCGDSSHQARDCPKKGTPTCYNCGAEGHVSRECTAAPKPKSCYKCQYNQRNDGSRNTYIDSLTGGNEGHFARDCPQAGPPGGAGGGWGSTGGNTYGGGSSRECYRCGGQGHIARDCTSSGGGGGGFGGGFNRGGGGQTCYSCGGIGHMSRVELRNATTVANRVTSLAIAHPSHPLSASATNASNQDTCSPLAPTSDLHERLDEPTTAFPFLSNSRIKMVPGMVGDVTSYLEHHDDMMNTHSSK